MDTLRGIGALMLGQIRLESAEGQKPSAAKKPPAETAQGADCQVPFYDLDGAKAEKQLAWIERCGCGPKPEKPSTAEMQIEATQEEYFRDRAEWNRCLRLFGEKPPAPAAAINCEIPLFELKQMTKEQQKKWAEACR